MKLRKNTCPYCKKKFTRKFPAQKYCNKDCQNKDYFERNKCKIKEQRKEYYENHKEQHYENNKRWKENHPRKAKQVQKKAFEKWRKKNPERYKIMTHNIYMKNRDKQLSRTKVYKMLRVYKTKILKLNKICFVCDSRYKVWLFFDIYPLTPENILKALKENKVRYLCRRHWRDASKKRKARYLRQQKKEKNILLPLNSGGKSL